MNSHFQPPPIDARTRAAKTLTRAIQGFGRIESLLSVRRSRDARFATRYASCGALPIGSFGRVRYCGSSKCDASETVKELRDGVDAVRHAARLP
jgi:hypothetical protein